MTVVRYQPWGLVNRLHREFDPAFGDQARASTWVPAVDVREEDSRFVVRADLPGVKPEQIEVTADKGLLTLRGERAVEEATETTRFQRVERLAGKFERRFQLPEDVRRDAIEARYSNGVLELSIPKQAKAEPRRITVAAA
jgi:HSP20 family protein